MVFRSSPRKRGPRANVSWIPACAGMNGVCVNRSGNCANDEQGVAPHVAPLNPGYLLGQFELWRHDQYCTDGAGLAAAKSRPMPYATLYWWKAAMCARMGKNAVAPRTRAYYEAQEKAWRKVAELLEVNETDRSGQPRGAAGGVTWWPLSLRSVIGGKLKPLRN